MRCRECDICHEQMGGRDVQWWLMIPRRAKAYYGCPSLGMKRYDVCDDCMCKILVELQMREKFGDDEE